MRAELLDILRCPYCGGRLELVKASFHRFADADDQAGATSASSASSAVNGDDILDGILACHCCVFPVVDGIAVMHLEEAAPAAREHVEAGRPDLARRALLSLEGEYIDRFEQTSASPSATYRDTLNALGPAYERGYFLYRFSDPSYLVARPFIRAIARAVVDGGRAIDLCGGSGHLTRALIDLTPSPPVLADLYFAKLWLARRFTAPGCEAICCNGNSPLPFARGAFRFAMCADAFMFIWTKRQFVADMLRLVGDGQQGEAAVITHTHNQRQWSPSLGDALPPEGYLGLFETAPARLYSELALFEDVMRGGPLDLARQDAPAELDADPALMIVASRNPRVFAPHPLDEAAGPRGELRINPLYAVDEGADGLRLRLAFPDEDYEAEFGACRRYLPDTLIIDRASLAALDSGRLTPALADLVRRRVILDLPRRYY